LVGHEECVRLIGFQMNTIFQLEKEQVSEGIRGSVDKVVERGIRELLQSPRNISANEIEPLIYLRSVAWIG